MNQMVKAFFVGGVADKKWMDVYPDSNIWKYVFNSLGGREIAVYEKQCVQFGRHERRYFFRLMGMPEDEALGKYLEATGRG